MLRYLGFGLISTCVGLLCNLLAGAIQQSVGQFTMLQMAAMLAGIMATMVLSYQFETRWGNRGKKEIGQICEEIAHHRDELRLLSNRRSSGAPWTSAQIDAWQSSQRTIAELKRKLRARDEVCTDDPIDEAPPPALGCLMRMTTQTKQISMMFVFPFLLAVGLSFSAVAFTHGGHFSSPAVWTTIAAIRVTPAEPYLPTSTTSAPGAVAPTKRPPVTFLPASTATSTAAPSPTAISTRLFVPTPPPIRDTPVGAPPSTQTPAKQPTDTPTPSVHAAPQLISPPNGSVISASAGITPELRWAGQESEVVEHFLLYVQHKSGASWIVTDATFWRIPDWLSDFQPIDGFIWWVAVCRGAETGEHPVQPCTLVSPPSETWRFKWVP